MPDQTQIKSKLLITAGSIMQYLDISRPTFYKWLKKGMPATLIEKRWYAHQDNLDEFFKKMTKTSSKKPT